MKTYKLHLSIGVASYLKAESYHITGGLYCFCRRGCVVAEFPTVSVLRIEEIPFLSRADLEEKGDRKSPV